MDTETVGGFLTIIAVVAITIFLRYLIHRNDIPVNYYRTSTKASAKEPWLDELITKLEFIESSVDVIRSDRRKAGLPDNASYQAAYFAFLTYLFTDIRFINSSEKNSIKLMKCGFRSVDGTRTMSRDLIDRFERQFDKVKRERPDDFAKTCIFLIEMQLCDDSLKNDDVYLFRCMATVSNSVKFILEALKNL